MSGNERIRLDAVLRVQRQELSVVSAAKLAGISLRQMHRIVSRYRNEGDAGLVHRLRGRLSNRRLDSLLCERIVKRHQERYRDFGPTFACEKLAEEGLVVSPNTLTRLLKERGLWQPRRKRSKHRRRRERRACFGSLVQMDGSHHDWLEGRGNAGQFVLMVLIDDATNRTYARFYPSETTEAAFDVFGQWVQQYGLSRGLYVDKDSIYRNAERPEKPTQFGRAMAELGVELICAHSPQAKGRVERRNGVFQDRLVKELRLRDIRTIQQANAFLERYLPRMNRRFSVTPVAEEDHHRMVPPEVVLEEVLCIQERRTVGLDWCVRWTNRFVQIDASHAGLKLPRRKVLVRQLATGELQVSYRGQVLRATLLPGRPQRSEVCRPIVNNIRWTPPANHPWKRGLAKRTDVPVAAAAAAPSPLQQAHGTLLE